MKLDSTLSAATQPFQPQAALPSPREDDVPRAYPVQHGLARSSPTPGLAAGSPVRRTSLSHRQSSDDDGVSTDTSISDKPLCRRRGSRRSQVARVVVTPMELAPLERGVRKRMDFLVRPKSPNLGARRVILMM